MGKLSLCQANLIALLNADPFFVDRTTDPDAPVTLVPIVAKSLGIDLQKKLDESLLALGFGLVVVLRRARRSEVQTGNRSLDCQFALTAVSNPLFAKPAPAPPPIPAYDIVEAGFSALEGRFNGVNPNDERDEARFSPDESAIAPLPDPKRPFLDIQLLLINTTIDLA